MKDRVYLVRTGQPRTSPSPPFQLQSISSLPFHSKAARPNVLTLLPNFIRFLFLYLFLSTHPPPPPVWTLLRREAEYPNTSPCFQLHPISTIPCEYALSVAFLPGDRHAVVAAKSGLIQLFDVAAASILQVLFLLAIRVNLHIAVPL